MEEVSLSMRINNNHKASLFFTMYSPFEINPSINHLYQAILSTDSNPLKICYSDDDKSIQSIQNLTPAVFSKSWKPAEKESFRQLKFCCRQFRSETWYVSDWQSCLDFDKPFDSPKMKNRPDFRLSYLSRFFLKFYDSKMTRKIFELPTALI